MLSHHSQTGELIPRYLPPDPPSLDLGVWLTNESRDNANEMLLDRNKTRPLNKVLIISEPKATEAMTVQQLKDIGMVGVYEVDISRTANDPDLLKNLPGRW